jgi:hypothetical protein
MHSQHPMPHLENIALSQEINENKEVYVKHLECKMYSNMPEQQLLLREWHQAVLQNMTRGREATALETIYKSDVLEFLVSHDSLGFRIRFKPNCHDCDLDGLHDVLGTLMSTEPCSSEHQSAAGAIGQNLLGSMLAIGQDRILDLSTSPHIIIGSWIKEPDLSMQPSDILIGDGVLNDGFGFPFPTLVVEVAFAESRAQLLEDLERWISPETSVQVAIGIKIHGSKHSAESSDGGRRESGEGSGDGGPIEAIDAFLYRRSSPTREQSIRFHPPKPGVPPPVLRVRLADLLFGVAPERLPPDARRRAARGETVEVDLGYVRERVLSGR